VHEWTGGRFGVAKAPAAQAAKPVSGATNAPAATEAPAPAK